MRTCFIRPRKRGEGRANAVGVGARRYDDLSALRTLAPSPLHPSLRVDPPLPATRGEVGKTISFSRRGCVRALHRLIKNEATVLFLPKKGRRSAERRTIHWPRSRKQVCALCATHLLRGSGSCGSRSPSGASRRRLPERANAPAQPRPCFTRSRGCRRYPHRQSRLSQTPGAPVVMPAGIAVCTDANCVHLFAMPEPPGSGVTSPARRNRTRPIQRLSPVDVPEVSEMGRGHCHRGGKVKGFRFVPMNQDVSRQCVFADSAIRALDSLAPSPRRELTPSAQTPRA